jgi:hypothetical protein
MYKVTAVCVWSASVPQETPLFFSHILAYCCLCMRVAYCYWPCLQIGECYGFMVGGCFNDWKQVLLKQKDTNQNTEDCSEGGQQNDSTLYVDSPTNACMDGCNKKTYEETNPWYTILCCCCLSINPTGPSGYASEILTVPIHMY